MYRTYRIRFIILLINRLQILQILLITNIRKDNYLTIFNKDINMNDII